MKSNENKLLELRDLRVSFFSPAGEIRAVGGISFGLEQGKIMGIVGESGAGKTVSAYAIMGLLRSPGRVFGGEVLFEGEDVLKYGKRQLSEFRGGKASMIFQDPAASLNPVFTVGSQLSDAFRAHNRGVSASAVKNRVIEMLELVGIDCPERRMKQYPHEFSGGMLQRVMIAMALICRPRLLIADEPTSALDVTLQAQILELIKKLQTETGMSVILITHDLSVAAEICDSISVMYAGQIVEQGSVNDIFYEPAHPYTLGLLQSIPREDGNARRLTAIEGSPADLIGLPDACPFAPRCESRMSSCLSQTPPLVELAEGHICACRLPAQKYQSCSEVQ